ncbi:MAG TPA: hypothetical protein VIH07_04775 [Candidatus Humimicrobiaceae bacterium]
MQFSLDLSSFEMSGKFSLNKILLAARIPIIRSIAMIISLAIDK